MACEKRRQCWYSRLVPPMTTMMVGESLLQSQIQLGKACPPPGWFGQKKRAMEIWMKQRTRMLAAARVSPPTGCHHRRLRRMMQRWKVDRECQTLLLLPQMRRPTLDPPVAQTASDSWPRDLR